MIQVKMGVGNIIFSNLGSIRSQYVFFTTPYFVYFFYFQYYEYLVIQPHIIEIIMLSG